jgi:hypothetical protein
MPERHLLDVLKNVHHAIQYTRHFGPPSGAHLSGADLSGADLRGANFRGPNLKGANLEGEILYYVKQISSVKTLYQAQLDQELLGGIQQKYPQLLKEPELNE